MTILEERSQQWQGKGGPQAWVAAWERTRTLLGPVWPDSVFDGEHEPDTVLADAAAGLATALYLVSRERGIPVSDVRRTDIEQLTHPEGTERIDEVPLRWESRLRRLGHDLEDTSDPVVARWRILRIDRPEPRHDADYGCSFTRQGPGVLEGMSYVLSRRMDLQI